MKPDNSRSLHGRLRRPRPPQGGKGSRAAVPSSPSSTSSTIPSSRSRTSPSARPCAASEALIEGEVPEDELREHVQEGGRGLRRWPGRTPLSTADRTGSCARSPQTSSATARSSRFLRDPTVTEVMVNGPDNIYVERDGPASSATEVASPTRRTCAGSIDRIVARVGRRIDEASPMVDARLPDGSPRQRHHPAAGARRPDR